MSRIFVGRIGTNTLFGLPLTHELLKVIRDQISVKVIKGNIVDRRGEMLSTRENGNQPDFHIVDVTCYHVDVYLDIQFTEVGMTGKKVLDDSGHRVVMEINCGIETGHIWNIDLACYSKATYDIAKSRMVKCEKSLKECLDIN